MTLNLIFLHFPVGHCASVGVRVGALGGQRRAAATTLVELLPAAGHVGNVLVRVAVLGQKSHSGAELYSALSVSSR